MAIVRPGHAGQDCSFSLVFWSFWLAKSARATDQTMLAKMFCFFLSNLGQFVYSASHGQGWLFGCDFHGFLSPGQPGRSLASGWACPSFQARLWPWSGQVPEARDIVELEHKDILSAAEKKDNWRLKQWKQPACVFWFSQDFRWIYTCVLRTDGCELIRHRFSRKLLCSYYNTDQPILANFHFQWINEWNN